jgi:hypothetical protein
MGKIITIREHTFSIPTPKDKRDILFYDQKDPYWIREEAIKDYRPIYFDFVPQYSKLYQQATIYDQDNVLITLNKDDSDYIVRTYEREIYRRTYGVHVKISNEIIWLTGDHWFILAWCKTRRPDKKGDYFDYREFQANFLYLLWYVSMSDIIEGLIISKAKKTGITNLMWLCFLNIATMTKNINLGCMNIDQDKAAKTFRDHFLYAYHGLPLPLKPQVKSKSEPDGRIVFGQQFSNSKKSKIIQSDNENELNTTVMCVPTMVNAFDVDVFFRQWYDEYCKTKQDFGEIYRSNEAGTNLQDTSIGKKILTNYTPEENSSSFYSGKQLYYDSKLRTIKQDSNGQTTSKLICDHIPAFESWTSSFDKYGRCNEKDAMTKIQAERDKSKGRPRELQALIRRYANNDKEAWSVGGTGSVFDNMWLGEIMSNIEAEERDGVGNIYVEGDLEWENNIWNIQPSRRRKGEFCKLKFVPLSQSQREKGEEGTFRFYYDIPKEQQNLALKFGKDEWGCLIPPDKFPSVMGGDPTSFAAASEIIEGSKNAAFVMSMPDELLDARMRKVASKIIQIEYFNRKESPDDAFNDYLKLILYTGSLACIEGNQSYVSTRLMEEGLGRFMLVRDENGIVTIWKRYMGLPSEPDKTYKFIRTTANADSKDMMETIVRLLKSYFERPAEGGKNYGATCKSARFIDQLMNVDITNTKIYDLFMAGGYTVFGVEFYMDILLNELQEEQDPNNMASVLEGFSMDYE